MKLFSFLSGKLGHCPGETFTSTSWINEVNNTTTDLEYLPESKLSQQTLLISE